MRILYTTRTIFDNLYLAHDGFYDGTALEVVLTMKRTTVFGERTPLDQYIAFHRDRIRRLRGVDIPLTGDTPESLATSFLDALITLGVVTRWRDDTSEGEIDHAKQGTDSRRCVGRLGSCSPVWSHKHVG